VCSIVDEGNDSTTAATWREEIMSVYAEATEDDEGRQTLTIQHRGQISNTDNTDGDVRSTAKDAA